MRDPYVLEFTGLGDYPALHEKDIEQALIDNIEMFLLELGRGFCLAGRQKLIRMDDRDFHVDLVFYNNILKCYVLIDLKLGELTYQDIGQMDGYVRMYEEQHRRPDDNPTIGLSKLDNVKKSGMGNRTVAEAATVRGCDSCRYVIPDFATLSIFLQ